MKVCLKPFLRIVSFLTILSFVFSSLTPALSYPTTLRTQQATESKSDTVEGMAKALGIRDAGFEQRMATLKEREAQFEGLVDKAIAELQVQDTGTGEDDLSILDENALVSKLQEEINGVLFVPVETYLGKDGAYKFFSKKHNTYVIVLNSKYSSEIQEELKQHDADEIFWQNKGYSEQDAHVIASALQRQRQFLQNSNLTGYDSAQLKAMSPAELQAIQAEGIQARRKYTTILERANRDGAGIDIPKLKQYEARLRRSIPQVIATRSSGTPAPSFMLPLAGKMVFNALKGTDIIVMSANIRTVLSMPGIIKACKDLGVVVIFQQAKSELGYCWPGGYKPENAAALAQMIREECAKYGFTDYLIKGDHITVNPQINKEKVVLTQDEEKIIKDIFEPILREKNIARRQEIFEKALAANTEDERIAATLKQVKDAQDLVQAEVNAGFNVFALDASFLPLESNILVTVYLDGFIPQDRGHEAEVGEIGGAENTTPEEAVRFLEGLFAWGVKIDKIAINNGTKHGNVRDAAGNIIPTQVNLDATKAVAEAIAPFEVEIEQHGITGTPLRILPQFRAVGINGGHVGTLWQNSALKNLPPALKSALEEETFEKYDKAETRNPKVLDNIKNLLGLHKAELDNIPTENKNNIDAQTYEEAVDHLVAFGAVGSAKIVNDCIQKQVSEALAKIEEITQTVSTEILASPIKAEKVSNEFSISRQERTGLVVSIDAVAKGLGAVLVGLANRGTPIYVVTKEDNEAHKKLVLKLNEKLTVNNKIQTANSFTQAVTDITYERQPNKADKITFVVATEEEAERVPKGKRDIVIIAQKIIQALGQIEKMQDMLEDFRKACSQLGVQV